jgi:aspartate kinase
MIVQNIGRNGVANLTFTVPRDDSARAEKAVAAILEDVGGGNVSVLDNIAKLSVVGVGMRTHSGVAASVFQTLADHNINIDLISTSEIKISIVIDLDKADEAARAVHKSFGLG